MDLSSKNAAEWLFGLLGFPLGHSFSPGFFNEKFKKEGLTNRHYALFPLENLEKFDIFLQNHPQLRGLNVTVPYKKAVMAFLTELHPTAAGVGAVNCIKIAGSSRMGFNTDVYGFETSLLRLIGNTTIDAACILGTGGAAAAVQFVLNNLQIPYFSVSRTPQKPGDIHYQQLNARAELPRLIIHTTPVGMYPKVEECLDFPFHVLTDKHFVFDLIYNPAETVLLQRARDAGALTKNGLEMLYLQAEKAWEIWNETE